MISAASHKINDMIQDSLNATQEQRKEVEGIHRALFVFKETMAENIKNSEELNKVVKTLSSR